VRVLVWWASGALAFAILILAPCFSGVDVHALMRDTNQIAGVSEEIGILSTAGNILWGAALPSAR